MKVAQQLTCLTLGRPNGLAYSTSELLNTPLDNGMDMMKTQPEGGGQKWIYHCYADERRIC